jgi:lipopolysaccharide export system permease protein
VRRIDSYILGQLLRAFGFFGLVFTGVVWLTQAVRLIDTVIASGQPAGVFLEFSMYVLPQVFVVVLPLAGLGATLFAVNKLYAEAELIVMMAAGTSTGAILKPVALFGVVLMGCMALTTMVLVPRGATQLAERTQEIRSDLLGAFIVERQFLHPGQGLTLFITETTRAGEMAGLFLHDERVPARPVTYSAERALLLRDGDQARLVMVDGVALTRSAGATLNTVVFDQFVFDLSELLMPRGDRSIRPAEYSVLALLSPTQAMIEAGSADRAAYIAEAHWKLVLPLLALLYPLVAVVTLLAGPYRRGGFGKRIVAAIALGVVLHSITLFSRTRVQDEGELWPIMYSGFALGLIYIAVLVWRLNRGRRAPRGAPA